MPQSRRSVRRVIISLGASLALAVGGMGLASPPATAAPPDAKLHKKLTSVMSDSRVQKANTGAVVLDPRTKKEYYSRNATKAITPASNTKIITAAAAMRTLGPDYRFKTEVMTRSAINPDGSTGWLYLKGYGDPTTMQADYRALAEKVKAAGIKRVKGHLVVDGSYFDTQYYNPNWSRSYISEYYAAQISGLTVAPDTDYDAGTVIVKYSPASKGKAAKYTLTPASAAKYVKIVNKTKTVAKGSADTFKYKRASGTNTITLTGNVPQGKSATKEWVTVHHPHYYAGAVFREELTKLGIRVDQSTISRATPADGRKVIGTDRSMKLSQLLRPFMKLSNNSHAEHLTKAMGAKKGARGNWADGIAHIKAYAKSSQGPLTGLKLVDGSGLARANKINPRLMVRVLNHARYESWFPDYLGSFPLAGNSDRMTGGTLKNRMRGTNAQNNARAKTGSLSGVTALSGYVRDKNNKLYVFSVLSEYSGTSPRPVEDRFVNSLASHRP